MQGAVPGSAQTVNFSGKDVPLKTIFASIKTQTGIVFFYDENLMKEAKPVTVILKDIKLETALNEIFKDQPLTWSLEDKTVTIIKRSELISNQTELPPSPKSIHVKGIVTDEKGDPISDVTVMVKGKEQGSIADSNGRFHINALQNEILIFSSVSYITKEIKVEKEETNIQLQLDVKPMEAYLVGGNLRAIKRKADATTVTVIDSKTLEKIPFNTIDQIFRGWVPGTNNFDVGDSPEGLLTLSIRGSAGSSAVAKVAVYIDGIEYAGGSGICLSWIKLILTELKS